MTADTAIGAGQAAIVIDGVEHRHGWHPWAIEASGPAEDLRAWTRWLDTDPPLAAELNVASVELGVEAPRSSETPIHVLTESSRG